MSALMYEGDGFNGSVGVLRDVSARKERARELERQNRRLDEFASIVSHDLRNPLSIGRGQLELAQEDCESEHLEKVEKAHTRMETLIDDMLTYARDGTRVENLEQITVADLARGCWDDAADGSATLTADADETILADKSRLRQLLGNLFRNAVEHGGDNVHVRVGALPDGFYVADDGPGIPAGERQDVFDPGYSSLENGTGFGLAIVREIATAHDWTIEVTESQAGGARFEITDVRTRAD